MARYVPKKGDFVVLSFDPQSGHEQRGWRPALVISNTLFNKRTGMAMVCPVTHTDRKIPFHVPVDEEASLTGFIMVEQVKSVDYRSRNAKLIGPASRETLDEVLAILDACVYESD